MPTWIVTLAFCGLLATAPMVGAAESKSPADTLGEAGRTIVQSSRASYAQAKDFFVAAGRSISQGAREAYEEVRRIGPKIAADVQKGFQGDGPAPAPSKEAARSAENP